MVRVLPSITRPIVVTAVTACVLACLDAPGHAQTGATMIPIEKMAVGAPPAEFEFGRTGQGAPGQWVVVEDPTATAAADERFQNAMALGTSRRQPALVRRAERERRHILPV